MITALLASQIAQGVILAGLVLRWRSHRRVNVSAARIEASVLWTERRRSLVHQARGTDGRFGARVQP